MAQDFKAKSSITGLKILYLNQIIPEYLDQIITFNNCYGNKISSRIMKA